MAPRSPKSTSPYQNWQEIQHWTVGYRRSEEGEWVVADDEYPMTLVDEGGVVLYESEYSGLFRAIIQENDVFLLNQHLAKYPRRFWQADIDMDDPFLTAASSGSTDALRVLLEHCAARPDKTELVDARGSLLLHTACRNAHIDTVRFLLDSESIFRDTYAGIGDIHARDNYGRTAILSAAESFAGLADGEDIIRERAARSDELMRLLLDRGASARDHIEWEDEPPLVPYASLILSGGRVSGTVLSLAMAGASYQLVKRLVEEGADVHTKESRRFSAREIKSEYTAQFITPLHIGSFYSNVDGIQALLDYRGSNVNLIDIVSCRDSCGCLPLHLAARGPSPLKDSITGDYSIPYTVATVKLLLNIIPTTINSQNKQGETPLHYAIQSYSLYGSKHSDILKFLFENGADAGIRATNGQSPLHWLCSRLSGAEPMIDLLLAHGANINDADLDGNTPLHLAARNLPHIDVMRFLLSRGADEGAKNSEGNTPLHEAAGRSIFSESQRRAQDETMWVLEEAGGNVNLMNQQNTAGKTPREICGKKRNEWQEWQEDERKRLAGIGMGRGRGRGRGRPTS